MVLVFILCGITVFFVILILLLCFSTIRINVNKLKLSNIDSNYGENIKDYSINISMRLFNKIKWLSVNLNDKKIKKIQNKMNMQKIDFKKLKGDFKLDDIKLLKEIKIEIAYLDLLARIGVDDVVTTSFIIFAITMIISLLLPHVIEEYKDKKYNYKILPLYLNRNAYEIKLDCIIEVKMVHIINIVYVFLKKRRVDRNERTSNRRPYGYSYE